MLEKITHCKVLIITIVKTFKKLQKMFNFWIFFLQKHFVELCGGQSNDGVHTGDVGPAGPRFSGDSERGRRLLVFYWADAGNHICQFT